MPKPKNTVHIDPPADRKPGADTLAWGLALSPLQAVMTIGEHLPKDIKSAFDGGLTGLFRELQGQVASVNKGNLDEMESLLITQAITLNTLFHQLAHRAQVQEYLPPRESYLKLAMRAQNQCRATIETLATIKNPPNVAFVKQANVAQNQQINNGPQAGPPTAPAKVIDSTPQLEQLSDNHLDTGAPTAAGNANPAMATVGEIHRTADRPGQG